MYNDSNILITGGTGTVGQEVTKGLLTSWNPGKVVIFSRNEVSQVMMKARFNNDPKLDFVIGDVRDRAAVKNVCKGIDYIFHLAALKHVGICERQPDEAIKTNIHGTENIIKAAIAGGVKRVINMSTDKAVNPVSSYGHTKAMGERLIACSGVPCNPLLEATAFINIRSGNVFGSSGSVVLLFIDQLKRNNEITITDGNMTRYFVSLRDIADFLLRAMQRGSSGKTYIMDKLQSFRLRDLAEALIELKGDEKSTIREIGARSGEKTHEELFDKGESVICLNPSGRMSGVNAWTSSLDHVITKEQLKQWIYDNGYC